MHLCSTNQSCDGDFYVADCDGDDYSFVIIISIIITIISIIIIFIGISGSASSCLVGSR